MISHNLEDVFQVADRIIVLRLGERVATFDREKTTPEQVVGCDHRRGHRGDAAIEEETSRSWATSQSPREETDE